ncbi:MAG: DUF3060 domain-containing protein [Saprospiraceae bacterium]|nr:DUF3060 domain-containing protein [Saprospiraceae bacterium]
MLRIVTILAILWTVGCTDAPVDPRTETETTAQSNAQSGLQVASDGTPITSQQVLDALAKMDQSTVKVSGTAGGVRIETDGTSTKTIPQKKMEIGGTGLKKNGQCDGEHVLISGVGNVVTLTGRAGLLELSGSDQIVYVESVDQIELSGSNNAVYWAKKIGGKDPTVLKASCKNCIVSMGEKPQE